MYQEGKGRKKAGKWKGMKKTVFRFFYKKR